MSDLVVKKSGLPFVLGGATDSTFGWRAEPAASAA